MMHVVDAKPDPLSGGMPFRAAMPT